MKYLRGVITGFLLTFCFKSNIHGAPFEYFSVFNSATKDSTKYKVYKIDSINNYYLIYAKKGHSLFKIISKKESMNHCKTLIINKWYKLQLHSILSVNGHTIIPANQIMEFSGWGIDETTTIAFEGDSIRDLYYADNIKGLCLIKKKKTR